MVVVRLDVSSCSLAYSEGRQKQGLLEEAAGVV